MQNTLTAGIAIARERAAMPGGSGSLTHVADVLELFPKRLDGDRGGTAVRSATSKFLQFSGSIAADTPIHLLETEQQRFVEYLRSRHHAADTVRSYRYWINVLLKKAREYGWETPAKVLPPDWAAVMALCTQKELKLIVRFAVRIARSPSTFSEDDLKAWCQERVNSGRSLEASRSNVSLFRRLMSQPDLAHLRPLVQAAPAHYGTPLRKMYPLLREEVQSLLALLTDKIEFDRIGPALRAATAEVRLSMIERLVGFAENVQGRPRIECIPDVLTRDTVTAYIKFALKRGVLGESLFTGFSGLRAAIKKHPRYADLDLNWLAPVLKQLSRVSQTDIDLRKEGKYIPFEAANLIPGKIREARTRAKNLTQTEVAISIRNELIMQWLVIVPWRQRNLRECRLNGGSHRNLYLAPIPQKSAASQPGWLQEQERAHPGKPVWQIYFSVDETKSSNRATGFLPYELVKLVEEYLSHRAALIPSGKPDPGTLFLNEAGEPITQSGMTNLVRSLSSVYAGKAVNPHLFRDVVAFEWLEHHPDDYLTLSKVLWHKTVDQTLKVYGSRFNESTGIARMDDWRAKMRRAA